MNRRLAELAAFIQQFPLEEKILVCPDYSVGHQLCEALTRQGHNWFNLRPETLLGLALTLVGDDLAERGLKTISPVAQTSLVEQAIEETPLFRDSTGCFGNLRDSSGLAGVLSRALVDLRLGGITGEPVRAGDAFVSRQKAEELFQVLRSYERVLTREGFIDQAAILSAAIAFLGDGEPPAAGGARFVVMSEVRLRALEEKFLLKLAGERLYLLNHDPVADIEPHPLSALARTGETAQVIRPIPHEPSVVGEIFSLRASDELPRNPVALGRALGESNEVRGLIRSLLERRVPFDTIEVLHTDPETYLPLFFEIAASLGIPCTFAEGVPAVLTRPGRALLRFIDWIEGDFQEADLRRLFASGDLDLGSVEDEGAGRKAPGPVRAVRLLREATVGWGRERYIPALELLRGRYEARLVQFEADAEIVRVSDGAERQEPGRDGDRQQRLRQTIDEIRCLEVFAARLLGLVPDDLERVSLPDIAAGARGFVAGFARRASARENQAATVLMQRLEELGEVPGAGRPVSRAVDRLRELVRSTRVSPSTPRSGHLHVGHCASGGYSGRPELFVLGLDERRFPGRAIQEPILLDEERARLSPSLPLARDATAAKLFALTACLASQRGRITLSYSCRDLLAARDVFPSSVLLQAHRLSSGDHHADYSRLEEVLPDPAGFLVGSGQVLTDSEWWLARTRDAPGDPRIGQVLDEAFSWLAEGRRAEALRASGDFTVYDGHLVSADGQLDFRINGRPISASRLEDLASCPFAFFLKHVLNVAPPEDLVRDDEVWLDPLQFGSLLHEVFERFMRDLAGREERPRVDRHRDEIRALADRTLETWRQRVPAPNDAAVARRRRDVHRALEIFLANEERHCESSHPRYFEVPFGMGPPESPEEQLLWSDEPVAVPVGPGGITIRGFIDRIDQVGEHEYHIWDYKTGSTYKYPAHRPLNGGRVLQHALYGRVAETLLRARDSEAIVSQTGYFFAGPKGDGERITFDREQIAELEDVLADLLDTLREGAMTHTRDKGECKFCDYQVVCGGADLAACRAAKKLTASSPDGPLEPQRRLHERDV